MRLTIDPAFRGSSRLGRLRTDPDTLAPMSYETMIWEQDGGIGRITLNRPDSLNSWNMQFGTDLKEIVENAAADDSVRAVLVTGAGRGFSSGADLKAGFESTAEDGGADIKGRLHNLYHPIIVGLRTMPKPVIAAVNGPAAGIGLSLALSCDLVLAAESSFFQLAFVNIGLMPDGGSTLFVPVRVGKARAMEMAMLGERLTPAQALDWGLINRVYPDDQLMDEANALVTKMAAGPTRSYAGTKQALNAMIYPRMDEQLALEAELQHALGRSKDFFEGGMAFMQKRDPAFTGE
jgi:2-(1,2-epoxy-1,2-dihydrophenyl)acetyl-CoA isomerase